ncbi:MAG: glycosyltransferase family 2 protein [Coriobacteriales bacterium]
MSYPESPLFSIVMPMYNSEEYIADAISCVELQTVGDWELIIVNDASTDRCREIAGQLAEGDERIRIIDHEKNEWVAAARNTGIADARGKYLWMPDPDDIYEPNLLEKCAEAIEENGSDVVVFGHVEQYFDANGEHLYDHEIHPTPGCYGSAEELRPHVLDLEICTSYGYPWNKIYDLEHIRKNGIKFENQKLIEDIMFNIEVFQDIDSLTVLPDILYHYPKRMSSNLTNKFEPDYYELHRKRIQSLRDQQESWGLLDDDTKSKLGCLYARYILSALARNHEKESGMTRKDQEKWIAGVFDDPLFNELIPLADPGDNTSLEVCLIPLKDKRVKGSVRLGSLIKTVKKHSTETFTKLKSKR